MSNRFVERYIEFRKTLESKLKSRHSKKVESEMESFYAEFFEDEVVEYDDWMRENRFSSSRRSFTGPPDFPIYITKDLESAMEKISPEARNLGIPEIELAGYCFQRLLGDAIADFTGKDKSILSQIHGADSVKNQAAIARDAERISRKIDNKFKNRGDFDGKRPNYSASMHKLKSAKTIAEKFGLDSDEIEIVSRNIERVKKRARWIEVIIESVEEGDNDSLENENAKKAFKELENTIEREESQILREQEALFEEDMEKWMSS